MKKAVKIMVEVLLDVLNEALWFLGGALYPATVVIEIILPYVMLFVGVYCFKARGEFSIGGEMFLPLIVLFMINFIRRCANKIGRGNDIPLPEKRFTSVDDYGEVSIDSDRLQELILYMGNLEDWAERKGLR